MTVKAHLKTPTGQRYTAVFDGTGPSRQIGEWIREYKRLGPLCARCYTIRASASWTSTC
jgi:hypothetical protein